MHEVSCEILLFVRNKEYLHTTSVLYQAGVAIFRIERQKTIDGKLKVCVHTVNSSKREKQTY